MIREPAGEPAAAGEGRKFAGPENLVGIARAAFGPGRRLVAVERLRGGSKKGVYRLTFDDGGTVIGYVWNATENYWPAAQQQAGENHADPFSDASGADLFEASHAYLDGLGVRVPQVYLLDRGRTVYPADVALVEDVRGESLETHLERGLPGADQALARLGAALAVMHRQRGPRFGKIAYVAGAAAGQGGSAQLHLSCEQIVLDRALADLDQAAARDGRVAAAREQLAEATRALAAAVPPRAHYGLIHGELGPDHVLIDDQGHPVIIDIEGVMFSTSNGSTPSWSCASASTTGGCARAASMTGGCGSTASPCTCRSSPGRYGSSTATIRTASRCWRSSSPTSPERSPSCKGNHSCLPRRTAWRRYQAMSSCPGSPGWAARFSKKRAWPCWTSRSITCRRT